MNNSNRGSNKTLKLKSDRQGFNYGKKLSAVKTLAHDKELKKLMSDKSPVIVRLMSGRVIEGIVSSCDRYTIKMKSNQGATDTFFKHSIESFGLDERRTEVEQNGDY